MTSSIVTTLLIEPGKASPTWRTGEWPGSRIPGSPLFRRGFRYCIRRQHHPHPGVCGRLGDGWSYQSDPALSAALRHGPGMVAGIASHGAGAARDFAGSDVHFSRRCRCQGGRCATGVLVLMTSGSIAVAMSSWRSVWRWPFVLIAIVFVYTTVMNIQERPEGIKIASFFIALTVGLSMTSRALRSTELRATEIEFDDYARQLIGSDPDGVHAAGGSQAQRGLRGDDYERWSGLRARAMLSQPMNCSIFLEIERVDASDFEGKLEVSGVQIGPHGVLRASSPAVPNAIAALLSSCRR